MTFLETFHNQVILFDGPMETRLKYEKQVQLPQDFSIFHFINDVNVSVQLAELYTGDIRVTQDYCLPIILNMPTYRASENYLKLHQLTAQDVAKVNQACFKFVDQIRQQFDPKTADIFILGPVGPQNDAYSGAVVLPIDDYQRYHTAQIEALAAAGVDCISIATMPNASEALGCALAAATTKLPYTIGFIVDRNGCLLDGTLVTDAIALIDNELGNEKPLCYLIFCTHPSVAVEIYKNPQANYQRISGIKANGSSKPLEELAASNQALSDPPDAFAKTILDLTKKHDWHLIGGCCGTNRNHLKALCQLTK